MKTHETTIKKYNGTMKELARDIADLRYDALAELMERLSIEITIDTGKDYERGRTKLAYQLDLARMGIAEAKGFFKQAWKICEKYMNIKESTTPEIALNKTKESVVKHFENDKIVKSKYDHWKEDYWEENEEDIVVTWEYFNNNYNWCDKCKSYQEGSCLCYTR